MHPLTVRRATLGDVDEILTLYRRVAGVPGGLARAPGEVTHGYVHNCVGAGLSSGIVLVAEKDGQLIGEIHAVRKGIECFRHILSDLTIAVSPDEQGNGVGRALFEAFMELVREWQDILRVELIARESNQVALGFYESLGFVREGVMRGRIKGDDGAFEADIPMAWLRATA